MKKFVKVLIRVLVPILTFCIGIGSLLIFQNIDSKKDVSVSSAHKTSKVTPSYTEIESKTSHAEDIVYASDIAEYVLENGSTSDGIEYEYQINSRSKLIITDDEDYTDYVKLSIASTPHVGYNAEICYYLWGDTVYVLFEGYNNTQESCECRINVNFKTYKKTDRPSTIKFKWDGRSRPDVISLNWSPGSAEAKEIVNNFTHLSAQTYLENFLTALKEDLCPMFDLKLSDFGFEAYK